MPPRLLAALASSAGLALAYEMATRLAFRWQASCPFLAVMLLGFLFVMPVGVGAVTAAAAPSPFRTSWWYAFLTPWLACVGLVVASIIFALDALICLVIAQPLLRVMSSIGGLSTRLLPRSRLGGQPPRLAVVVLARVMPLR